MKYIKLFEELQSIDNQLKFHLIYNRLEGCYEIYRYIGNDHFKCFIWTNLHEVGSQIDTNDDSYSGGSITHGSEYINDYIKDNRFDLLCSSDDLEEVKEFLQIRLDAKKYNV